MLLIRLEYNSGMYQLTTSGRVGNFKIKINRRSYEVIQKGTLV